MLTEEDSIEKGLVLGRELERGVKVISREEENRKERQSALVSDRLLSWCLCGRAGTEKV